MTNDKAIEAAAEAIWETGQEILPSDANLKAKAAIEAATPYILAGQWQESMERRKGDLVEFPYEKYGEHIVAVRCDDGNKELFDAVKLFSANNSRAEYERVKDDAAQFAKDLVRNHNIGRRLTPQTPSEE